MSQARFVPSVLLKTLEAVWQRPAGGAVVSLAVPTYREVPHVCTSSYTDMLASTVPWLNSHVESQS